MTWNAYRNRGELIRTVSAAADERRDGLLPMDLDGVADAFDELTLLGALLLRWHTRLSGRIERRLLHQPLDLEGAVVAAWHDTADEMPGVRLIIDHYREHPTSPEMAQALAISTAKERTLLAVMAGRAAFADGGAPAVGRRIEERAKASYTMPPRRRSRAHAAPGLIDRLKAALVA